MPSCAIMTCATLPCHNSSGPTMPYPTTSHHTTSHHSSPSLGLCYSEQDHRQEELLLICPYFLYAELLSLSSPPGMLLFIPTSSAEDLAGLRVPHPLQAAQQVLEAAVTLGQELQEALRGAAVGLQHLQ